jgi:hypothetical protein
MASQAGPFPDDPDDELPGVSIRPLSHHDLDALLAGLEDDRDSLLAGTTADRPVVALRVRATVGRPGASAHTAYQARRAGEFATWLRGLPWRLVVTLGIGVAAGLLALRLSLLAGVAATGLAGWALRFRTSRETQAWRRGATGERRTAQLLGRLERHGWAILHDLAVPGSRANIDCDDSGAAVAARSDPNVDRPGALRVDLSTASWPPRAPTSRATVTS